MRKAKHKTLRLILGDQLNYKHSWFREKNDAVVYLIMEMKQETGYVLHHAQKLIGFFAAMYNFAAYLRKQGHNVIHLMINDPANTQDLTGNILQFLKKENADAFEYMYPDEYRLDQQLKALEKQLSIPVNAVDTEHFYTTRDELGAFFGNRTPLMERFYRAMRQKYGILLSMDGAPEGGNWNFDKENREPFKAKHQLPDHKLFSHDYSGIWKEIQQAEIDSFGKPDEQKFSWPTTRKQSLEVVKYFMKYLLPSFGKYQDAMQTEHAFLYHARISFALNTKMIAPAEVVNMAIAEWKKKHADLASVEGFIRQILGWREFMRGIYWWKMPGYAGLNKLQHKTKLPEWFWTGNTKMNCLRCVITQSLDTAYAHHIQRLMVSGNFLLLAGIDPDAVDQWYLGIYIDAIEWVEITNTRGMSQFADGGIVGTKPYVSSAAYINKMSDYCKNCHYKATVKTGEGSCPFNSLYWHFFNRHRQSMDKNPRLGMVYKTWDKMSADKKEALLLQADAYLDKLNEL
ncbi:MAG: cryptochrome/photolyase family protein [Chitinophagaceae bacterium]